MMKNQPTIITSHFKQHFQLVLPGESVSFSSAEQVQYHCPIYAEIFIRRQLNCSDTFWRNVIRHHFSQYIHELTSIKPETLIGKLAFMEKIRFYRLPLLEGRQMARYQGNCYRFLQGPEIIPEENAKVIGFHDEQTLSDILDSLDEDEGFWCSVLEENNLPTPKGNASAKAVIKKNLISGKLRVYESQYRAPIPKPQESPVQNTPFAGPVPLAPETYDDWVEIELIFDDGEPIADQRYVIVDPDGNQHTGTTNAQGKAKVSNITVGNCECSFPELEGWD